jgi:hypothetical protein
VGASPQKPTIENLNVFANAAIAASRSVRSRASAYGLHAHPKEVYLVEIDRRVAKKILPHGASVPERPPSRIRDLHDRNVHRLLPAIIGWVCAVASRARVMQPSPFRCSSRELRYRKIDLAGSGRQVPWRACA